MQQVINFSSRKADKTAIEYAISISSGFDGPRDGNIEIKQTAPNSFYSVITLNSFDLAKLQQCKNAIDRIIRNHIAAGHGYLDTETNVITWITRREQKNMKNKRICPVCGKEYDGYPALSRKDNETEICPECGTREALAAVGITGIEADEITAAANTK